MSDGMSEYWRERRKAEREKSIKFHFYDMITALLYNRISLKRGRLEDNKALNSMFETMLIK